MISRIVRRATAAKPGYINNLTSACTTQPQTKGVPIAEIINTELPHDRQLTLSGTALLACVSAGSQLAMNLGGAPLLLCILTSFTCWEYSPAVLNKAEFS